MIHSMEHIPVYLWLPGGISIPTAKVRWASRPLLKYQFTNRFLINAEEDVKIEMDRTSIFPHVWDYGDKWGVKCKIYVFRRGNLFPKSNALRQMDGYAIIPSEYLELV